MVRPCSEGVEGFHGGASEQAFERPGRQRQGEQLVEQQEHHDGEHEPDGEVDVDGAAAERRRGRGEQDAVAGMKPPPRPMMAISAARPPRMRTIAFGSKLSRAGKSPRQARPEIADARAAARPVGDDDRAWPSARRRRSWRAAARWCPRRSPAAMSSSTPAMTMPAVSGRALGCRVHVRLPSSASSPACAAIRSSMRSLIGAARHDVRARRLLHQPDRLQHIGDAGLLVCQEFGERRRPPYRRRPSPSA